MTLQYNNELWRAVILGGVIGGILTVFEGRTLTIVGICHYIAAVIIFAIGSLPFEKSITFELDLENDQIRRSEKTWFWTEEEFHTLNLIQEIEVSHYRDNGNKCYRILFIFSDGKREDLMKFWAFLLNISEEECQYIAKEIAEFLGLPLVHR